MFGLPWGAERTRRARPCVLFCLLAFLMLLGSLAAFPSVVGEEAETREAPGGNPRFLAWGPSGFVRENPPEVTAFLEPGTSPDPLRFTLALDGVNVKGVVNGTSVRFRPGDALDWGRHEARIEVLDGSGNVSRLQWAFHVVPLEVPGEVGALTAASVPARRMQSFSWSDAHLDVTRVDLTLGARAENLTLVAREHRSLPPSATRPPLTGVRLVSVWASAEAPLNVSAMQVHVSLPASWLAAQEARPGQILAFRAQGAEWVRVPAEPLPGIAEAGGDSRMRIRLDAGLPGFLAVGPDTQTPRLGNLTPAPESLLTQAPLEARAEVTDNFPLPWNRSAFTLNGEPLQPDFPGDALRADLPVDLADGRHALAFRAEDEAGNRLEHSWSFLLDRTGPAFPSALPEGVASTPRPRLAVAFSDSLSGVDAASVRVLLDGADVTLIAEVSQDGVALTPRSSLSSGSHVLEVHVRDRAGNEAVKSHAFETRAGTPGLPAPGLGFVLAGGAIAWRRLNREG